MTTCEQLAVKLFGWTWIENEKFWRNAEWNIRAHLPQWDSTWQGAGEVIEAMKKQSKEVMKRFGDYLWFDSSPDELLGLSPKAIAKAALAALEESE